MENASKALIMAGGVLIGILVLSLATYLFLTFGAQSKEIHAQIDERQLTQYNAQYTVFTGRNDVTIYDIISIANLASENNEYYKNYGDYETSYKVVVKVSSAGVNSTEGFQDLTNEKKQEMLEHYSVVDGNGQLKNLFTCMDNKTEYHANGRIAQIVFRPT